MKSEIGTEHKRRLYLFPDWSSFFWLISPSVNANWCCHSNKYLRSKYIPVAVRRAYTNVIVWKPSIKHTTVIPFDAMKKGVRVTTTHGRPMVTIYVCMTNACEWMCAIVWDALKRGRERPPGRQAHAIHDVVRQTADSFVTMEEIDRNKWKQMALLFYTPTPHKKKGKCFKGIFAYGWRKWNGSHYRWTLFVLNSCWPSTARHSQVRVEKFSSGTAQRVIFMKILLHSVWVQFDSF